MTDILIRGRPYRTSLENVERLLEWVSKQHGLDRFQKPPILVGISFRKGFHKKTGYLAWMSWEDDYIKPREFAIEIEPRLDKLNLERAIIHEMSHVYQYVSGRMKDRGHRIWLEKKYANPASIPHSERPWEKDAYKLEDELYSKWVEYKNRNQCDKEKVKKEKNMSKSKTNKLLNALQNGSELSVAQAINRFGFECPSSVTGAVSVLRSRGYAIYSNTNANGVTKYRIGTPTKSVVAAGYAVLGAEAFA